MQDAYALSRIGAGSPSRLPRRVALVDDVMTTGATVDACSRVLREGGVEWIGALTLARAARVVNSIQDDYGLIETR